MVNMITPIVESVNGLVKTVFGSRAERDQNDAAENIAVNNQFAAEFKNTNNIFDSIINGINRLPRPFLTLYICWLVFVLPLMNIEKFIEVMTAYQAVPELFWALIATIVGFFFGGRMQVSGLRINKSDIDRAKEVAKELKQINKPEETDIDSLAWLDNPSIQEWKAKTGRK